jgi:hypothetical protein
MDDHEIKQIGTFLLSAIDMEEQFANSVYSDYTKRKNWPADIDEQTYQQIQEILKMLLEDTDRHKKKFLQLKEKLARL